MARSEPQKLERITVIGAGTIGASWAAYILSRGLAVRVRSRYNEFAHGQYDARSFRRISVINERWLDGRA